MWMQKTIAEQNSKLAEQSARIATLEKQRTAPTQKTAGTSVASTRSVTVAGASVPLGELPPDAIPSARTPVRDANTFLDLQNVALDGYWRLRPRRRTPGSRPVSDRQYDLRQRQPDVAPHRSIPHGSGIPLRKRKPSTVRTATPIDWTSWSATTSSASAEPFSSSSSSEAPPVLTPTASTPFHPITSKLALSRGEFT